VSDRTKPQHTVGAMFLAKPACNAKRKLILDGANTRGEAPHATQLYTHGGTGV